MSRAGSLSLAYDRKIVRKSLIELKAGARVLFKGEQARRDRRRGDPSAYMPVCMSRDRQEGRKAVKTKPQRRFCT